MRRFPAACGHEGVMMVEQVRIMPAGVERTGPGEPPLHFEVRRNGRWVAHSSAKLTASRRAVLEAFAESQGWRLIE